MQVPESEKSESTPGFVSFLIIIFILCVVGTGLGAIPDLFLSKPSDRSGYKTINVKVDELTTENIFYKVSKSYNYDWGQRDTHVSYRLRDKTSINQNESRGFEILASRFNDKITWVQSNNFDGKTRNPDSLLEKLILDHQKAEGLKMIEEIINQIDLQEQSAN